jgi:hypothetical protein
MVLDSYERDSALSLSDILSPDVMPQVCKGEHQEPWYPANKKGKVIRVLPTLVARIDSHAFRNNGPGMVQVKASKRIVPLSINERELALGYERDSTAAPGLTYEQRHTITGSCFDAHAVGALMSTAIAIRLRNAPVKDEASRPTLACATCTELGGEGTMQELFRHGDEFACLTAQAEAAEAQEGTATDIWNDSNTMLYIKNRTFTTVLSECERRRVLKRAAWYEWDGQLKRRMRSGDWKTVLPIDERRARVKEVHEQNGHFGRRRTAYLVLQEYWWPGLFADVKHVLTSCQACCRTNVAFNTQRPVLNSLPIQGKMYRWGLDLFGPYPESSRGNKWVLVCVEHYSKWVEAFPMPNKSASEITYQFLHGILARFGASAEVITDGGGEFEAAFDKLLVQALIDHRVTSASHPQANGLSERTVKTLKTCISRYVDSTGNPEEWDMFLPWIVMGYRVTPQESTKVCPFTMLYGVSPVVPPNVRDRLGIPLDLDANLDEVAAESHC